MKGFAPATIPLTIYLLGGLRLTVERKELRGLERPRLQELLAYLLLNPGRPVPRLNLATLFWRNASEKQARANFRNLWHRLRQILPDADCFLRSDNQTVQWRADAPYWLDVAVFENCLTQAGAAAADEQIDHLTQAVNLYQGELLPCLHSDWLLSERERLAQAYGRALTQLAQLHETRRHYPQAISQTRALLRHDPLHEPAYAQLIRLHALNAERAAALHAYHTCASILRRELDVEPDTSTRQLYEQLLSQPAPRTPQPPMRAAIPLVGRDAKWEQLQQIWRQAVHQPRLALITGEAGIGKTRLAEALLEWVARQGIPALTARCYATAAKLAYAPIVGWLRSQPLPPLPNPWLRELARLLPEILVEHQDLPPPGPLQEDWQRLRLFEAMARALLNGCKAILLFLDDLHWCDQETLDWLTFLLSNYRDHKRRPQLLVIAALRSEEIEPDSHVTRWQADLIQASQLVTLPLGPLSEKATVTLADHVAGRPFDRTLAPLLYQTTEGHPLFIVEMVRAGFEQQTPLPLNQIAVPAADHSLLPDRVRQVLEGRLAQLSPPAREVIEWAAVIGRTFNHGLLTRLVQLNGDLLASCLDECWRRRIIREQGHDSYFFSHEKLRETAYASLSQTRRRWLHSQVARALAIVHASNLDAVAAPLAGHYEAAQMTASAIVYYLRAAAAASRIFAHEEAEWLLQKGIGLLPDLAAGAEREKLAAQLQEARGDLQAWRAQHELARAAYQAAADHIPAADKLAQARLRRKIGKTMENERLDYGLIAAAYETAAALLDSQPANTAAWWEEWCALQLDQLGFFYWWQQLEGVEERIAHVHPLIEQHGTPEQQADFYTCLIHQSLLSHRFAPPATAVTYARAALSALASSTSPELLARHQFVLGFTLLWHGDSVTGAQALHTGLELAEQSGDVVLQGRCLAYLVAAGRRQGNEDMVDQFSHRCLAIARKAQMFDYMGAAHAGLAWLAWRRGASESETERLAQLALADWQRHGSPYPLHWQALWPLIGAYLAQGCLAEAILCVKQLCDPGQQALPAELEEPLTATLAAWEAGRFDSANRYLQYALTTAQQMNYT